MTDTDLASHHYRVVGGDRLLLSGRSTTWEGDPRRYGQRLKADIEELYPQLRGVEIEHAWSGVLGNALHRMPQIGELSPGLWFASGFGGHGLNTTAMAGQIISRAIVDGDDTWRLFSPYEFVWAGGRLGRAVMQVYSWWFTARERFEARQARQREEEFRRAEERAALRAPEEEVEAQIGAAVPADELPAEPALAELPADPVVPRPSGPGGAADETRVTRVAIRRRSARSRRTSGRAARAPTARRDGVTTGPRAAPCIGRFSGRPSRHA